MNQKGQDQNDRDRQVILCLANLPDFIMHALEVEAIFDHPVGTPQQCSGAACADNHYAKAN